MNEIICTVCQQKFIKSINRKQIYCSKQCYEKHKNSKRKKKKCKLCNNTMQSQSKICRQCFLIKIKSYCQKCGKNYSSKNSKYCENCKIKKIVGGFDYTLKDATYTLHHKSSAYALVRTRARAIASKLGWNSCKICGYNKHIEVAHIKSISSFGEDTLVSIINDPSNLVPLCPNCHWELDNGLLFL